MKLIPKDAVLAEINKRMSRVCGDDFYAEVKKGLYRSLIIYLNSLEEKEVDLEEEIERVRKTHFINDDFEKATLEGRQITNIAKHFFELGLKAQKGE